MKYSLPETKVVKPVLLRRNDNRRTTRHLATRQNVLPCLRSGSVINKV